MSPQQVVLVQESFKKVMPISEVAAQLFYGRLFEVAPEVKPLFKKADMEEQGRKLMQTLAFVTAGLTQLDTLLPVVQALGRRHVGYGVQDEHYAIVGAALLWTLEQGLGDAFTPQVKEAWGEAYTLLAGVMQAA